MKLARTGIIAVAMLAVATIAFAQKPDFSGTWTLDPEASGMQAGAGGGGGGGRRGMAGPKLVISTQRPGAGGEMMTATETWSLEGGNLVVESTGGRGAQKRVYKKTT